jgi:hypothetical protein
MPLNFATEEARLPKRLRVSSVTLDGADITDQCFAANVETGTVGLFVRDPQTGTFVRRPDGDVKIVWKRGEVTVCARDDHRDRRRVPVIG